MKNIFILVFFTLIACKSYSQTQFPFSKMKVNFAIPDLPAFKALGTDPSNILRPSTPEAFNAILPQFRNSGSVVLPKSFALELSPSLLLDSRKSNMTLKDFENKRAINSLRISIGTTNDSTQKQPNATKLALGLRISLINKGDLKYDRAFHQAEGVILAKTALNILKVQNDFLTKYQLDNGLVLSPEILTDPKFIAARDKFVSDKRDSIFIRNLADLKTKYKKEHWNDCKLDIAAALVWRSADQNATNLDFNKFSLWTTGAIKCKDWGQWLIGANYSYAMNIYSDIEKKNIDFNQFSLSSRLYVGSNNIKGFVEGQYMNNGLDKSNNFFVTLGGETTIFDGIWLHFYGGYQSGDKIKQVISSLDFRFTIPEK